MPISLIKRAGILKSGAATGSPLVHRSSATSTTTEQLTPRRRLPLEALIVCGLAMVAFVPRIILALQLDLVTDEAVYITAGKLYIAQIRHFDMLGAAWSYNYEHPPFVKLLIGLSVALNALSGHPCSELLAARIPSVVSGTLLVVAVYWLGRVPFGRTAALLAALCLAVSPWLAYFSALAYLDMTTTTLMTIAFLLLVSALRQPRLYLLIGVLVGLGLDSKYTASLLIPGMLVFVAYDAVFLRTRVFTAARPKLPVLWWLAACIVAAAVFFIADPAIWPQPLQLLLHSLRFEWDHAARGHLTFIAGGYDLHAPGWTVLYVLLVKISIFTILPAGGFLIFSLLQLTRFHVRASQSNVEYNEEADSMISTALLMIWLVSSLGMFSLLDIAVGTHYFLLVAPPLALAGAVGMVQLLRWLARCNPEMYKRYLLVPERCKDGPLIPRRFLVKGLRGLLAPVLLVTILVVPHASGLFTVYGAEGYSSELFNGEDRVLQVAYPGYREAIEWLVQHTDGPATIGLVALNNTLENSGSSVSWFRYNSNLPRRFKLTEVHPGDYNFAYDYVIWPMHLQQRGYTIPAHWQHHLVHTITGGKTIYCYILARNTATSVLYKEDFLT